MAIRFKRLLFNQQEWFEMNIGQLQHLAAEKIPLISTD